MYRIFIMVFCKNVYVIGTYTEECSKKYDSSSKIADIIKARSSIDLAIGPHEVMLPN